MPDSIALRLYIIGDTFKAERALANLRRICDLHFPDRYELSVVDVLEQPQMAEQAKILATPTLVRLYPPPVRRVVGDLSDAQKVLAGLGLRFAVPSDTD